MWIVELMRYRQTDQPTDRPTDTASYRGALSHLKRKEGRKYRLTMSVYQTFTHDFAIVEVETVIQDFAVGKFGLSPLNTDGTGGHRHWIRGGLADLIMDMNG